MMQHFARSERSTLSDFVRRTVLEYMEDLEDLRDLETAIAEHKANPQPFIPHEEIMREFGLA